LEARQRKPISVRLVLTTSQGNRINYSMWNRLSWRPALATAGVLKKVGEKVRTYGGRSRRYPIYELSREDMFHVLRHTYASTQLEAGESIVSVSAWPARPEDRFGLLHLLMTTEREDPARAGPAPANGAGPASFTRRVRAGLAYAPRTLSSRDHQAS